MLQRGALIVVQFLKHSAARKAPTGNTARESGNNSASRGASLLLRSIIFCRAPRYEPLLPLQHALCHELCGPSRFERGAPPFRDVRHRGA
jgi:hypothetical protein